MTIDLTTLRYIAEVTPGTTPVAGTWQALRHVSEDIAGQPRTVQSQEARGDREPVGQILAGLDAGGTIQGELSYGTYDDLIEGCFGGAWDTPAADQITLGVNDYAFSFEREYIGKTRFAQTKGNRVTAMALNVAFGEIATVEFTLMGTAVLKAATSLVGAGSTTPATTTRVMTGSQDITALQIDGAPTTLIVRNISLNIDNNGQYKEQIGQLAPFDVSQLVANITGSMELYLSQSSIDLFEEIVGNTPVSLDFRIGDGTNTYLIDLPRLFLSGTMPGWSGRTEQIMQTVEFSAAYDSVAEYSILIDRSPA